MSTTSPTTGWIRTGLVALPLYGLLVGYATLTPQPDQSTAPQEWARFVSSPSYLAVHIGANVLGPVLVIFGTLALGALLARSRAPRLALGGTVLAITGQILFMVPGTISTFATPPIAAAYLAGNEDAMTLQFSPVLGSLTAVALLLTVAGNTLLGIAIWRSGAFRAWIGALWIMAAWLFYVLGAALGMATTGASLPTQPVGGLLMAISAAGVAWTVLRPRTTAASATTPVPQR
jgi:hypothetical protein